MITTEHQFTEIQNTLSALSTEIKGMKNIAHNMIETQIDEGLNIKTDDSEDEEDRKKKIMYTKLLELREVIIKMDNESKKLKEENKKLKEDGKNYIDFNNCEFTHCKF